MKKAPVCDRKMQVLDPPFRLDIHLWMATISYIFTVCLLIYCLVGRQPNLEKGSIFGLFRSIQSVQGRFRVDLGSIQGRFWVILGSIGCQTIEKGSFQGQSARFWVDWLPNHRKRVILGSIGSGRVCWKPKTRYFWRYPKFRPLTLPFRHPFLDLQPLPNGQYDIMVGPVSTISNHAKSRSPLCDKAHKGD